MCVCVWLLKYLQDYAILSANVNQNGYLYLFCSSKLIMRFASRIYYFSLKAN